ncbi:MAG: chromate transporter [Bacteroidales bacterium]|nr:chromate transporter [Bacteroidales bacterium]
MLFLQLFWTFLKIGAFNFGGGYAMLALIQGEVVTKHAWITNQEFTDIVAISQMTPGPIGINAATYVGYSAVANAGFGAPVATAGAALCSAAVLTVPFVLMIVVIRFLLSHKENADVNNVLRVLRLAVTGLIAAAALLLLTPSNFGKMGWNMQFVLSCSIFAIAFFVTLKTKFSPVWLLLISGAVGLVAYSL